jgi:hypothetical protein
MHFVELAFLPGFEVRCFYIGSVTDAVLTKITSCMLTYIEMRRRMYINVLCT